MATLKADVVVVGAGIVGCSTTFELAENGRQVVLLDRRPQILQGMSAAGFGSLTPFSDPYFTGEARDFAARGARLYVTSWVTRLTQVSRIPVETRSHGLLKLLLAEAEHKDAMTFCDNLTTCGYGGHVIAADEIRTIEPAISGDFRGALLLDEPWVSIADLFDALRTALSTHRKVNVKTSTEAVNIEHLDDHCIVTTGTGDKIRADFVVVCYGLTEKAINGILPIPLAWIRGDAIGVRTSDNKPLLTRQIYFRDGFIAPWKDGFMALGATYIKENTVPTSRCLECRDRVTVGSAYSLLRANIRIVPRLVSCDIEKTWRGWRPTTVDELPVLGVCESEPRLIYAMGFIGLGVTMAPAVAEIIEQYVGLKKPTFPASLSVNRFSR